MDQHEKYRQFQEDFTDKTKPPIDLYFSSLTLNSIFNKNKRGVQVDPKLYTVIETEPALTWWIPQQQERRLILQLAHALNSTRAPFIFDAACGTGFVSKLLAAEGGLKIIGAELNSDIVNAIPETNGDIQIEAGDVWNYIYRLEPQYDDQTATERKLLLDHIGAEISKEPIYAVYQGLNLGYPDELSKEVMQLQQLIGQRPIVPSSVDIVICSFMPQEKELTIPIRDGIHPKAIIYVRPLNGKSGAGDYYLEKQPDPEIRFAVMSYHPGKHYRTAARWKTVSRNDWSFDKGKLGNKFNAEVIIQLRKDIESVSPQEAETYHYNWEDELAAALEVSGMSDTFQRGLIQVQEELFAA